MPKSNLVQFPAIEHKHNMATVRTEARAAASYLRERLRACGLTQEQAGKLIGKDGRQIRRWLKNPPPVVELLMLLEQGRKAA